MNWLSFGRAVRWGFLHFWRNIWLSLAATGVLLLTLAMLALLLVVTVVGREGLHAIEEKVDITVFLADDTPDAAILAVKADLEGREDVRSIQYVTKEQALAAFETRHRANPTITQALAELGDNPLQASLIVRAASPDQYPAIEAALKSPKYEPYVSKVSSEDNRDVITRLAAVLRAVRRVGFLLTAVLATIAVLVTFNTVRLAIYGYHEEIEIMQLVGASPWFIRGPFLIEGFLAGSVAGVLTLLYFFPLARALSPWLSAFIADGRFDLGRWTLEHVVGVTLTFVLAAVALSVGSSWIAVRRYVR